MKKFLRKLKRLWRLDLTVAVLQARVNILDKKLSEVESRLKTAVAALEETQHSLAVPKVEQKKAPIKARSYTQFQQLIGKQGETHEEV